MDNNLYLSGEEAVIFRKGTLQKSGYVFKSWNTNQQGNGTSYNGGDRILIVSANITLYAIWDELGKYTVAFETYDGSSVQALENIVYGSKITRPSNPTKAHSIFEGWFIDEKFETEWDFQNGIVESNLILYAKWQSTLYQVEVTDIYHLRIGVYVIVYWTNPTDTNFSHVRIIPAGYEWADSSALDKEPGITSYSVMDFANTEYVIIKCIGKDGNISEGIKYLLISNNQPEIITISNITGIVAPVTNNIPVMTINETNQYTGTVTWSPEVNGTFLGSTQYTATISLTPKLGYTLEGVPDDFFYVSEAISVNNAVNSGIITAVFPQTIASAFVTAPVLTLAERNENIIYSWTVSNPIADSYDVYWKMGSSLDVENIKSGTKITGAINGGTINGLDNGTAYSVIITANRLGYNSIDSEIKIGIPKPPVNAVSPFISYQPQGGSFFKTGMLSVTASVSDGGTLSYQWYRNISNSYIGGTLINNATETSYILSEVGTFYYYAVITNTIDDNNDGGSKKVTTTSDIVEVSFEIVKSIWAKSLSVATSSSRFNALANDVLGNVYAVGVQFGTSNFSYGNGVYAQGTASANPILIKYDSNGTALWARTINTGSNDSRFTSVAIDISGNIYAAGFQQGSGIYTYGDGVIAQGSSSNYENAVLVKYDSNGTALWARTVSTGNYNSEFNDVAIDIFGNIYVAGWQLSGGVYTYGNGVAVQGNGVAISIGVLVKYDSNGTALWANTEIGTLYSVTVDSNRNVFVGGVGLLVKYDTNGTKLWTQGVTGGTSQIFSALATDASDNVYAAGLQRGTDIYFYGNGVSASGRSSGTNGNSVLVKYNSNGTAQWAQVVIAGAVTVYNGSNASVFSSVAVDSSGNIYVAGSQYGTDIFTYGLGVTARNQGAIDRGSSNSVLVKYDSNGTALWAQTVVGTSYNSSTFNAVLVDYINNIYTAGAQTSSGSFSYGSSVTVQGAAGSYNAVLVKYQN